jgi:assimilatory nitrate reductase catalytic subunit
MIKNILNKFAEQLINNLTIADFDPKSFEPNFKQCAVNLYSQKHPEGIKLKEQEIAGAIEYQGVELSGSLSRKKEKVDG